MYQAQIAPTKCPSCRKLLDAVTNATGEIAPKPGDHTICCYCAQLLRFTPSLGLETICMRDLPIEFRTKFKFLRQQIYMMRAARN